MSGRLRHDVEYSAINEDQEEGEEDRCSYYGGASVPFVWESRPGTPKHNHFPDCSFPPPLTPPPSYYSSSGILSTPKRQTKVRTKLTRILSMSLFHDLRKSSNGSKKTTNYVSGSSYSSSSTSSSSSFSSSPPHSLRKPASRGKRSSVMYASYKEHELTSSPTSTLCYSNGGRKDSTGGRKGFSSSMGSMKRALFSGPRQGSAGKALTIGDVNKA